MRTPKDVALILSSLSLGLSAGLALCLMASAHRCPTPPPAVMLMPAADSQPASASPSYPCGTSLDTADTLDPIDMVEPDMDTAWNPLQAQLGSLIPARVSDSVDVGDEILARWTDGSWWEATVTEVRGPGVIAAWKDGSTPKALTYDEIAPIPERPGMEAGDLALCKWQDSTRWWRAVIIESSDEQSGALQVQYIDGTVEPFARQCVPAIRS